jgi:hypothetical protein
MMSIQILSIAREGDYLHVTAAAFEMNGIGITADNTITFNYQQPRQAISFGDVKGTGKFREVFLQIDHQLRSDQAKKIRVEISLLTEEERKVLPLKKLGLFRKVYNSLSESRNEPEIHYPSAPSRRDLTLEQILTIGDLTELTEQDLRRYSNIGDSAVAEIKEKLGECGLSIKGSIQQQPEKQSGKSRTH